MKNNSISKSLIIASMIVTMILLFSVFIMNYEFERTVVAKAETVAETFSTRSTGTIRYGCP